VTSHAGHNVTLTLISKDDNYPGDPTYTLFDDVSLSNSLACGSGAVPYTPGVKACAGQCVPVTPPSTTPGYCRTDCDCGNAPPTAFSPGYVCYYGPSQCVSTIVANQSLSGSQTITFNGAQAYTMVAGSTTQFFLPNERPVEFSFDYQFSSWSP
jgi:hypothetical protein